MIGIYDGVPIVEITRTKVNDSTRGTYLVYIECPHCSKTHQHGWSAGDEAHPDRTGRILSHRIAHCGSNVSNCGYFLTTLSQIVPK